ncbi:hypothetical protein GA0061070_100974 [Kosakonia oryziphila]|uniref:Uncharacterized protein n=1 Tax=Kosakonia oryziphila TaxID=1005667 RepID=A0A1C4BZ23_9ENTR|nr:hypothetical protein GA0061070_100974 [Kosakonia oryziphila]
MTRKLQCSACLDIMQEKCTYILIIIITFFAGGIFEKNIGGNIPLPERERCERLKTPVFVFGFDGFSHHI